VGGLVGFGATCPKTLWVDRLGRFWFNLNQNPMGRVAWEEVSGQFDQKLKGGDPL
jgi:hypothetical protein